MLKKSVLLSQKNASVIADRIINWMAAKTDALFSFSQILEMRKERAKRVIKNKIMPEIVIRTFVI